MRRFLSEMKDRVLLKVTLVFYYYIPVLYYSLKPFSRTSDIRKQYAGNAVFPSRLFAIYVVWQKDGTIPWYVRNMLEALKAKQVNTIVVANHELSDSQIEMLKELSAEVLVRGNKGRDFGAYRDAILYVLKNEKEISRLLMINDSVFVLQQGLRELLDELLSQEFQVASAYENWELHYHFQSFCLALSGDIVANPKFRKFWQNYLPVPIRRWCIDHGEVKFSELLRKIATNFQVVYRVNDLLDLLEADDALDKLLLYKEFVPKLTRKAFPHDDFLEELRTAVPAKRRVILRRAKERISRLLMMGSQVHTGAFFFPKFLNAPIFKRDLVLREQFDLYEVERMLMDLGIDEELPMIVDDIRKRGSGAHLKGFRRRRFRLGLT